MIESPNLCAVVNDAGAKGLCIMQTFVLLGRHVTTTLLVVYMYVVWWGWVDVGLGTFPDKAVLTVLSVHLEDYVGAFQAALFSVTVWILICMSLGKVTTPHVHLQCLLTQVA